MDDFPAGPTGPEPRRPSLSVVIPVRNGGRGFERCLRGLRDSIRPEHEWIVVDDGSTDESAALARSFGAFVLQNQTPLGPASARNAGARLASAPIVFFLDADVVIHADALEKTVARFRDQPEIDALFGSYDDRPEHPGVVSRFRNLLHHFVHQQGVFRNDARPVRTFWTGCGAIRRDSFFKVGGFDPELYDRPAIEDIELGYRLTRAGGRVLLVRDIQASHLKRWTLASVVRTDIFQRGVPWMLLMLRMGETEADLNVERSQRLCVALTGLTILAIAGGVVEPRLFGLAAGCLFANVAINRRFHRFLAERGDWRLSLSAIFLHQLYYVCCGISVCLALIIHQMSGRRRRSVPKIDPGRLGSIRADNSEGPRSRAARGKEATTWKPR